MRQRNTSAHTGSEGPGHGWVRWLAASLAALVLAGVFLLFGLPFCRVRLSGPEGCYRYISNRYQKAAAQWTAQLLEQSLQPRQETVRNRTELTAQLPMPTLWGSTKAQRLALELDRQTGPESENTLATLQVGSTEISAQVLTDKLSGSWYLILPGLTEQYLAYLPDDEPTAPTLQQLSALLPEQQLLSRWLMRYSAVIADAFTPVEKTTREVSAGQLSGKRTVLTLRMDARAQQQMHLTLLQMLRQDEAVRALLDQLSQRLNAYRQYEDPTRETLDLWGSFQTWLTKNETRLQEQAAALEEKPELQLQLYLTGLGQLCGICLQEDDVTVLQGLWLRQGSAVSVMAQGKEFALWADGRLSASGISGTGQCQTDSLGEAPLRFQLSREAGEITVTPGQNTGLCWLKWDAQSLKLHWQGEKVSAELERKQLPVQTLSYPQQYQSILDQKQYLAWLADIRWEQLLKSLLGLA